MNTQRAAEIQVLLEGISLPATRSQVLDYARAEDPSAVAELQGLPDEEFRDLDAIGELLTLAPTAPVPAEELPRPESGRPPGGDDYLVAHPSDTGRVRTDAPPSNPPQKALEEQTKTKQRQKAAG